MICMILTVIADHSAGWWQCKVQQMATLTRPSGPRATATGGLGAPLPAGAAPALAGCTASAPC